MLHCILHWNKLVLETAVSEINIFTEHWSLLWWLWPLATSVFRSPVAMWLTLTIETDILFSGSFLGGASFFLLFFPIKKADIDGIALFSLPFCLQNECVFLEQKQSSCEQNVPGMGNKVVTLCMRENIVRDKGWHLWPAELRQATFTSRLCVMREKTITGF